MLARKKLDPVFIEWNERWGAPFGYSIKFHPLARVVRKIRGKNYRIRERGPFSLQKNNDTRRFEYPWAYLTASLRSGMRVLEVGGGLSGFQFVLSKQGCAVLNVDPGVKKRGWIVNQETIDKLNTIFQTSVSIQNCGIQDAVLEPDSFDRAFSISVIEHLPQNVFIEGMHNVFKALTHGGLFILTIDLFLDVAPFTDRKENMYGYNVSILDLIGDSGFELVEGDKRELFGFPEFDQNNVLTNLADYFLGGFYPTLVQAFVLRKP